MITSHICTSISVEVDFNNFKSLGLLWIRDSAVCDDIGCLTFGTI